MACRHYCSELNPDTIFEVHNINVTTEGNKQKLKVLAGPSDGGGGRGRGGQRWGAGRQGRGGRHTWLGYACARAYSGVLSDAAAAQETVASGSLDRKSSVNMIIGCVDNWEARQVLEAVCEELQVPFTPSLPPSPPSSSPPLSPPPSPSPPLPPLPYLLARGSDATFHPRAPVVRVRFVARAG